MVLTAGLFLRSFIVNMFLEKWLCFLCVQDFGQICGYSDDSAWYRKFIEKVVNRKLKERICSHNADDASAKAEQAWTEGIPHEAARQLEWPCPVTWTVQNGKEYDRRRDKRYHVDRELVGNKLYQREDWLKLRDDLRVYYSEMLLDSECLMVGTTHRLSKGKPGFKWAFK